MIEIGYHASHEQFAPSYLQQLAIMAEKAGFAAIHSSDHFHPWSKRQGQSGYSFSWIAATLQVTNLPFSMVCAPGQRYHPAIVAQAIATLAEMFPGRINLELGSGEAINETITGQGWPDKNIRNERLLESARIIRRLLNGEQVSFNGHVDISNARLYTLPQIQPSLFCAAITEATARWAGSWADGLLTTAGDLEEVEKKITAFKENGGAGKPIYLQYAFSYSRSRQTAIAGAYDQWRSNLLPADKLANLHTVEQFDEAAETVTIENIVDSIPLYTDMNELVQKVNSYAGSGVTRIILHNVNRSQEDFINDYATQRN